MSESMIERVAAAIGEITGTPDKDGQEWLRGIARAAIEAMREPSGTMKDAGAGTYEAEPWIKGCNLDGQPSKAWIAMIDAALSEKPKEITVACRCGWQGRQSELNGSLCPKCSAPFKAWP